MQVKLSEVGILKENVESSMISIDMFEESDSDSEAGSETESEEDWYDF